MMIKAKSKLSFFDWIVLVVNWVFAVSILISYLAPYINPKYFWPVALFGLAFSPLLIVNIIFVVYWVFRQKKPVLISATCILLGYKVLPYNVGFNKYTEDAPKTSGKYIRVMNYNVHSFTSFKTPGDLEAKKQMLDIIQQEQPDVINIEEFFTRYNGPYDTVDSLKKILQSDSFYYQTFVTEATYSSGLAIFSKFPIINKGEIILSPDGDTNSIFVDLQDGDKIFRVYAMHLRSFLFEPVDYTYINNPTSKVKADVKESRRILVKLKQAFINRSEQVKIVKEHAAQCPYPYIFAGDFNDTPSSYAVHQMGDGMKNAFYEKGCGFGKTYNGDFPNFQIDYIMASPQFNVINYRIIEKKLSDHYPIMSDLLLK